MRIGSRPPGSWFPGLACFGIVEACRGLQPFSWRVGVFLGLGEGFIRLVRFIASTGTGIGKNKIIAFYSGTGLF